MVSTGVMTRSKAFEIHIHSLRIDRVYTVCNALVSVSATVDEGLEYDT